MLFDRPHLIALLDKQFRLTVRFLVAHKAKVYISLPFAYAHIFGTFGPFEPKSLWLELELLPLELRFLGPEKRWSTFPVSMELGDPGSKGFWGLDGSGHGDLNPRAGYN